MPPAARSKEPIKAEFDRAYPRAIPHLSIGGEYQWRTNHEAEVALRQQLTVSQFRLPFIRGWSASTQQTKFAHGLVKYLLEKELLKIKNTPNSELEPILDQPSHPDHHGIAQAHPARPTCQGSNVQPPQQHMDTAAQAHPAHPASQGSNVQPPQQHVDTPSPGQSHSQPGRRAQEDTVLAAKGVAAKGLAPKGLAAKGAAAKGAAAKGGVSKGLAANSGDAKGPATKGLAAKGTVAKGTAAKGAAVRGTAAARKRSRQMENRGEEAFGDLEASPGSHPTHISQPGRGGGAQEAIAHHVLAAKSLTAIMSMSRRIENGGADGRETSPGPHPTSYVSSFKPPSDEQHRQMLLEAIPLHSFSLFDLFQIKE